MEAKKKLISRNKTNARKWKHQKDGALCYKDSIVLPEITPTGNHNIYDNFKIYKKGGLIPKHQEGGTIWNKIVGFGKDLYGLVSPSETDYFFSRNGQIYAANSAPHPTITALTNWDTNNNLAKIEFKERAMENPNAFIDTFSTEYKTHYNNNNFDVLYGTGKKFYPSYLNPRTNLTIGKTVYNNLTDGWTNSLISAALGNSYDETGGWTLLHQLNNGPASGVFMMEEEERKRYNKWLQDNNLTDSYANQTNYVQHLFDTRSLFLQTPWSGLRYALADVNNVRRRKGEPEFTDVVELENFIRNIEDEGTAREYNIRGAWLRKNYTTDNAWEDWDSGDVARQARAFEALFERAGSPHFDKREYLSEFLSRHLDIFK